MTSDLKASPLSACAWSPDSVAVTLHDSNVFFFCIKFGATSTLRIPPGTTAQFITYKAFLLAPTEALRIASVSPKFTERCIKIVNTVLISLYVTATDCFSHD